MITPPPQQQTQEWFLFSRVCPWLMHYLVLLYQYKTTEFTEKAISILFSVFSVVSFLLDKSLFLCYNITEMMIIVT